MTVDTCQNVEENIRLTAQTKRIRIKEFFQDYDKLRSGNVTTPQFFRTLWMNLGVKLSEGEERALAQKYDLNSDSRMNYAKFCDIIDRPFDTSDLRRDPLEQAKVPPELLGTLRSCRPLSPDSESKLYNLLLRMNQYYSYHGINIKSSCEDFDTHNIGVVTESQFYRVFPGPKDVSDAEVTLLVRKYRDPEREGMVNYVNMHHDLLTAADLERRQRDGVSVDQRKASALPEAAAVSPSVQMVLDRIRMAVHKRGVRVIEFFRDYDKLRHDKITEHQFVCALSLAVGKEAQLSREEIQKLANFYRADGNNVRYRDFCLAMDSPYNELYLDKKPLTEVSAPLRGSLGRALPVLSEEEERRIASILREIAYQVRRRRINLYPYFKDYDRSKAYTRVVTPNQFSRTLHFLSLNVSPEDVKLLARKFAEQETGDVNYPALVQCVDETFIGQTIEPEKEPLTDTRDWKQLVTPIVKTVADDISFDELMARIRHIALVRRLRVKQFFEDFDPLRSGRMFIEQFKRCLSSIGLSKLGQQDLSDKHYQLIIDHYRDPESPDKAVWAQFVSDIDSVFTESGLESHPLVQIAPQETYVVPKPGTVDWNNATPDHVEVYENAMNRLRQKVAQRRMLVKPTFQAFDKHNHGSVTRKQFRQCMTMLDFNVDSAEMDAIDARFANDEGFNYFAFLEDLEPPTIPKFMYEERLKELRLVNARQQMPEMDSAGDAEAVLDKIRTQIFRRRIRIKEYLRDHDKLRSGRMPKVTFRRALDQATIHLNESELSLIEDRYMSGNPDMVEWMRFSDDIETIFTMHNLEKDPLKEPLQFKPDEEAYSNPLGDEENVILQQAIAKIADKVRQRRMQLFPLFEDFDHINARGHQGTLSQSQFRRALNELELASMLGENEWACLYKCFRHKVGTRDDVNYIAFCDAIYAAGNFEYRRP